MKILIELTYYRPHTSGLTIYAERLATALAGRGHQVTVLTSQYDKSLPREEMMEGVRVVRVPVLLRISKGVIMPTLGITRFAHGQRERRGAFTPAAIRRGRVCPARPAS